LCDDSVFKKMRLDIYFYFSEMIKTAIILAGGFGTRLQSVVSDVPKPMAPIGSQPFLHYLFLYLKEYKIEKVVLAVGYLHEKIIAHFGYTYLGIEIEYSIEITPLGTGGGIQQAISMTSGDVLILNGDTFLEVDLAALYHFHTSQEADLTISLKPMIDFDRYGTVTKEQHRIVRFNEKKYCENGLINAGVYICSNIVFEKENMPIKFSFEEDFMTPKLRDIMVLGYETEGYFIDIGIPDDYKKAQNELPQKFTL
jgi:D-glycero-alpha-D-manno-heptose 1-phosphate guanylyltransferase